jgi:hypothetical protein
MQEPKPESSRRRFFFGAATAGAAAAAASAIPVIHAVAPPAAEPAGPAPARGGGYSLSEHVKRYYKTTRL